ncbi:AraC family transcriptional regulator [Roseomonas sp. HF4]|uniref:AraC-like ligand-binding domain-containing protein n=1 Tax=Roseomonas sp. HF4 TaxID=2562313 RepID=UPI00148502E9|nr:AraC family transcriptional regulator [Roseomonas sp. HF4]
MPSEAPTIDPARLATFHVVQATDSAELDGLSRVSERFPTQCRTYKYRLQDRALWRQRFDRPIFGLATRSAGSTLASLGENRFATEVAIDGPAVEYYAITTILRGGLTLGQNGRDTTVAEGQALVYRTAPGTRILTSDGSARSNLFIKVEDIETVLEQLLDQRLRKPLEFAPVLDWTHGLAASLRKQLDFMLGEFERPDGVVDNAAALASMTDLLVRLVLRAVPHSYTDQLDCGSAGAVPAYVRRAEDFMRAHCTDPIRMAEVAAAAGCSLRTLAAVFRQFRGRTPLGVLHGVRLDEARRALGDGATDVPVVAVARRYGFTNATRFASAFRRRFGESPSDVVRRASRSA